MIWYNLTVYSLFLLGGRVCRIWTNFFYYVFHHLCWERGGGPKGNSAKFTKSSVFFFLESFPKLDLIKKGSELFQFVI